MHSFDEFYALLSQGSYDSISSYLSEIFTGFTPLFISNILEDLGIEDSTKDVNELEEIYDYIKNSIPDWRDTVNFYKLSNNSRILCAIKFLRSSKNCLY